MSMDTLQETIDLDIDESSELLFKVKIEGVEQATASVRLVCECGDVSYMFNGCPLEDDVVQFVVPSLKGRLKEGTYSGKVEVLVDNRHFVPTQFNMRFKKTVSVVAEAIVKKKASTEQQIKVTASPMNKPAITREPECVHVKNDSSAQHTLRSRYTQKIKEAPIKKRTVIDIDDVHDDELIRQLAREIVNKKISR